MIKNLLLFLLIASSAQAASYVQGANNRAVGTVTTTFWSDTAAGNLIVCGIASNAGATLDSLTVSDTQNNTYAVSLGPYAQDGTNQVSIVVAANIAGGPETVTLTGSVTTATHTLGCQEWFQTGGAGMGIAANGVSANPATGNLAVSPFDGVFAFAVSSAASVVAPALTTSTNTMNAWTNTCAYTRTVTTATMQANNIVQFVVTSSAGALVLYQPFAISGDSNSMLNGNYYLTGGSGTTISGHFLGGVLPSSGTGTGGTLSASTGSSGTCVTLPASTTPNTGVIYSIAPQSGTVNANWVAASGTWTAAAVDLTSNASIAQNPNAPMATIQYSNAFPTQNNLSFASWIVRQFNVSDSFRGNPYPYNCCNPYTPVVGYNDSMGYTVYQFYTQMYTPAQAGGWNYENMHLHMNVNWNSGTGSGGVLVRWQGMDQFNAFETTANMSYLTATNGAFLYNGTIYSDISGPLYTATCNLATYNLSSLVCGPSPYPYLGTTIPNGGMLYLSYTEPFDRANIVLTTPMSGGTATWQYWNGSAWVNLTLSADTTSGLTVSGQVLFNPPANWALLTTGNVIGSTPTNNRAKYWVRLTVTGAPTTVPTISTVKGDSWLIPGGVGGSAGAAPDLRGWCTTCTHINMGLGNHGELEYDPSPPANAQAHFRYQSRVLGTFYQNNTAYNPFDCQGTISWGFTPGKGACTLTQVAAMQANWNPGTVLFNGAFIDNSFGTTTGFINVSNSATSVAASPSWDNMDEAAGCQQHSGTGNVAAATCTWAGLDYNWMDQFRGIRAMYNDPATPLDHRMPFYLWTNGRSGAEASLTQIADNNLNEQLTRTDYAYIPTLLTKTAHYLPPVTGHGTMSIWDTYHWNFLQSGTNIFWDQSNRTPITGLAVFYIVWNPNLLMYYYTSSGWSYYDVDEFYYWSPITSTLTAPLTAGAANSKTVSVADGSQFAPIPPGNANQSSRMYLQIGGNNAQSDIVYAVRTDNNTFTITNNGYGATNTLIQSYPVGTVVRFAKVGHWSFEAPPPGTSIWYYTGYFPAMSTNIGTPDSSAGFDTATLWSAAGASNLYRRDFTGAIVLTRPSFGSGSGNPGVAVDVSGIGSGTFYPLNADGTTGAAVSSVTLRLDESAILMRQQVLPPQLYITTTSLPSGTVNTNYTAALAAAGGTTPYTWAATGLPLGLALNTSTGQISGTPTATGTSTVGVTVTDSATPAAMATANLPLTINSAPLPLSITTTSLPAGTVGVPYSASLAATGGTPPYTWTEVGLFGSTGPPDEIIPVSLPGGLTLNTDGTITGIPVAAGTSSMVATVTDTASATATAAIPVTITGGPPAFTYPIP